MSGSRRRSTSISLQSGRHPGSQQAQQAVASLNRDSIDQDIYTDSLTLSTIRHAVVADDGGVYEASSLLSLLKHSNGKSLIDPAKRVHGFIRVPALQNTIDELLLDDEDRIEDYELEPVLNEMQQVLNSSLYALPGIETSNAIALAYTSLLLTEHLSRFSLVASSSIYAAIYLPTMANAYMPPIPVVSSLVSIMQLMPAGICFLGAALLDQSIGEAATTILDASYNSAYYSAAVLGVAKLGLFGGRRLGIFPDPVPVEDEEMEDLNLAQARL